MGHCSNCGAEVNTAANFCANCGAALTLAEAARAETLEPAAVEPAAVAPAAVAPAAIAPAAAAPVVAPADAGRPPLQPQKIENHLIKSIIATVCCCVPFGVAGIVYAAQVDSLLRRGDRAAAEEASKKAGLWSNLAIGVGLVVNAVTLILTVFYRLGELSSSF